MIKLYYWFRSFKKVKTVEDAQKMNLVHVTNVFGDGINTMNCRSFWTDRYKNTYRCDELLKNGKDLLFEQIKNEHPTLFSR